MIDITSIYMKNYSGFMLHIYEQLALSLES